jgi:hypothetical protein
MTLGTKLCAAVLCSVLAGSLGGCKVSEDAIAASEQMTSTASALNDYYSALDAEVASTIELYELDAAMSGIPYGDADRKLQEATRAEIGKRKEMAESLAKLAASMGALPRSTAAADVQASATKLGKELVQLKALPGGSPIPDAIGKAGNFLLQIIQQHEEKKAARAMDETLKSVGDLFSAEKPLYDSVARTHVRAAGQIAQDLINANAVDPNPMLAPALKPFGLASLPPSAALQASLKPVELKHLQDATDELINKEEAASAAMLDALREMSSRVHLLATEKPMPLRGAPFSLKLVEQWAQSWAASLI